MVMFFLRQPRELFIHGCDFGGRSTRLTYWLTTLWLVLMFLVFEGFVNGLPVLLMRTGIPAGAGSLITGSIVGVVVGAFALLAVACIIPVLALHERRYRDTGLPGWLFWVWFAATIVFSGLGNGSLIQQILFLIDLVITLLPTDCVKTAVKRRQGAID